MRTSLLLFAIFLCALSLRLVNLGTLPHYLHQDEIMNGYVGRYILQNGKDLYGNRWPLLYFDNFGDYPNVIPMYISGASTFIFGDNAFGVRFPIAFVGALAIFPFFALCRRALGDKHITLMTTFLLAILPWHLVLSRATAENVLAGTAFLCGLYCLMQAIKTKQSIWLLATSAIYLLSYFLYPGMRVIVPISLLPTIFMTSDQRLLRSFFIMLVCFFGLTAAIGKTAWGHARFSQTSVFTFNNQVNNLANHYSYSSPKSFFLTTRIFNNKPVLYAREIGRQYLSYFSPQFLLTDGGHPDRYLVPSQGLLFITFIFVLGFSLFCPPLKRPLLYYFGFLLLLTPLPAALTLDEVPNVHRSALLGIFSLFLIGYALLRIQATKYGKSIILLGVVPLIILEFTYFAHQYFGQSPAAQAYARYDSRTILIKRLIDLESSYETIIVPREIFSIYYLFYTHNYSPTLAGTFGKNLYTPTIGKLKFVDSDCPSTAHLEIKPNTLLVDLSRCDDNPQFKLKEQVHNPDGTDNYDLMTLLPPPKNPPKKLQTP